MGEILLIIRSRKSGIIFGRGSKAKSFALLFSLSLSLFYPSSALLLFDFCVRTLLAMAALKSTTLPHQIFPLFTSAVDGRAEVGAKSFLEAEKQ